MKTTLSALVESTLREATAEKSVFMKRYLLFSSLTTGIAITFESSLIALALPGSTNMVFLERSKNRMPFLLIVR